MKFSMKDLNALYYFLSVEAIFTPTDLFLTQHKYIRDLLTQTNLFGAKEAWTPIAFSLPLTEWWFFFHRCDSIWKCCWCIIISLFKSIKHLLYSQKSLTIHALAHKHALVDCQAFIMMSQKQHVSWPISQTTSTPILTTFF